MPVSRITVAVLYGGRSPEHSISCVSAGAVMSHLDPERYEVVPVGITTSGAWVEGTRDFASLRIEDRELPKLDDGAQRVAIGTSETDRGVIRYSEGPKAGEVYTHADVIFPVLHGPNGEDGTIQGLLELSGVPYVGPGVFASSASMDKEFTKKVLGQAGLAIGVQVVLRRGEGTVSAEDRERLGLPVFVKPARGGSSIGITKVGDWAGLEMAIAEARKHDTKVIVEAGIVGREIECGVLELPSGEVRASLPAEIHFPDEPGSGVEDGSGDAAFYDFDTKYIDAVSSYDLPAKITGAETDEVRRMAVEAFEALDAKGLSRVDFFVTADGAVINEVNTIPGFTPISMYPKMWEASGIGYTELLDTLVQTALGGR